MADTGGGVGTSAPRVGSGSGPGGSGGAAATAPATTGGDERETRNWLIHEFYTRRQHDDCLALIEQQLKKYTGRCEYALYVKGLILRDRGEVEEALKFFQRAAQLNPRNVTNLKQVGRTLYLLGRHRMALAVYDAAIELMRSGMASRSASPRHRRDWELFHNKGLCFMFLGDLDAAEEAFTTANMVQRKDATFLMLGKIRSMRGDHKGAIAIYKDGLVFTPESPELLTTLGLVYLHTDDAFQAFDCLGKSMTFDPRNEKAVLAVGAFLQSHGDYDVALSKYRVAAAAGETATASAELWNNIGMCFFGKGKHVAAIACLKRAQALGPLEWITAYNLGLVHLHTKQWASVFHYLSAAINLNPSFGPAYMYLGVALSHLDDVENACNAYNRAAALDESLEEPHLLWLNYAISLYTHGQAKEAEAKYRLFRSAVEAMEAEARAGLDDEVLSAAAWLASAFGMAPLDI